MKKIIIPIMLILSLLLIPTTDALAQSTTVKSDIEYLDDGSYFETIIEDETPSSTPNILSAAKTTATKSKTTYYKNSSGQVMWYVKVTGTFKYGDGTSICTKATVTAASKGDTWRISNKTSKSYSNKAQASATGKQYANGIVIKTISKTVTLTCSSTGKFS